MKTFNIIFILTFAFVLFSCGEDDSLSEINVSAPSNVSASVRVTQDNSGLVTITPLGEGVTEFSVDFGDGSDIVEGISPGESLEHVFSEGSHDVDIIAQGLDGSTVTHTETIVVSFQAPTNLEVNIANDEAVSKQVNVTVMADYAVSYEVNFGENDDVEALSANIGETISYQYEEPGVYTITIEVEGAAIERTTYTEEFEVTAILQPLASAPQAPSRSPEDVISIFTSRYNNESGSDFFPDWGQGGQGSTWSMFNLNGDEILQYTNLSYQGNQFAEGIDVSQMEYVHFDFWTADILESVEVSLISMSNGERPVVVELIPNEWTSIDIPISAFTEQDGFTVNDIHQIKYVGEPWGAGTLFVDNIYFWKQASSTPSLSGKWKISPEEGSLRVGPSAGSGEWWSISETDIASRECLYDDEYVFGSDGTFSNVLGTETWIEGWQGGSDICAAPVAPHDGSSSANWSFNEAASTVTITGLGAYLGIPKAVNAGELPNVEVPTARTYQVSNLTTNSMTLIIESGSGVFWTFEMIKEAPEASPLDGTWKISPTAGSLRVGPSSGSGEWWSIGDSDINTRACFYDDEFIFSPGGGFQNVLGGETWVEAWQSGTDDACSAPIAPHDGPTGASYIFDEQAGTITISGLGAYLGIPKAVNEGELPNVEVPESRTYQVTFVDDSHITVIIESGTGVFWTFEMIKN